MSKPVPSLSAAGWLESIAEKADAIMAYYILSEYSQSHLYKSHVTSLTWHIQQYGNDPGRLETRVGEDLNTYFTRYFEKVDVNVNTDTPNPLDPDRINLTIDITVYEGSQRYSLGKAIESINGKVEKIQTIIK